MPERRTSPRLIGPRLIGPLLIARIWLVPLGALRVPPGTLVPPGRASGTLIRSAHNPWPRVNVSQVEIGAGPWNVKPDGWIFGLDGGLAGGRVTPFVWGTCTVTWHARVWRLIHPATSAVWLNHSTCFDQSRCSSSPGLAIWLSTTASKGASRYPTVRHPNGCHWRCLLAPMSFRQHGPWRFMRSGSQKGIKRTRSGPGEGPP